MLRAKKKCKSEGKCEGMNPHTPKGTSILGVSSLGSLESRWTPEFLESNCRGQNSMDCKIIYIIRKLLKHRCLKMGSHDPFGHLKHNLWPKERSGVKLVI